MNLNTLVTFPQQVIGWRFERFTKPIIPANASTQANPHQNDYHGEAGGIGRGPTSRGGGAMSGNFGGFGLSNAAVMK